MRYGLALTSSAHKSKAPIFSKKENQMKHPNPINRGDICVVVQIHSYHTVKMQRVEYRTFSLAKAIKVDRSGIAKEVEILGGGPKLVTGGAGLLIMRIGPEHQDKAERLGERLGDNAFDSAELLRDAILAA
jgi:hypothetical protein